MARDTLDPEIWFISLCWENHLGTLVGNCNVLGRMNNDDKKIGGTKRIVFLNFSSFIFLVIFILYLIYFSYLGTSKV